MASSNAGRDQYSLDYAPTDISCSSESSWPHCKVADLGVHPHGGAPQHVTRQASVVTWQS